VKRLKFKCTLLTDVILNVKSATEGSNKTLDFIPGNNFLGMVASKLYTEDIPVEQALDLFHNGTVRYGDAHVGVCGRRTLKVPAVLYYPKMEKPQDRTFVYYRYDYDKDTEKLQLKQCRDGFYAFDDDNHEGIKAIIGKTFAIKSAYDRDKRRSKDEQMYGYESLKAGLEFFFAVEIDKDDETDKDDYEGKIKDALVGEHHLGRSRTAQYGLVKIEKYDYKEETSADTANGVTTVCADGRLIFLDDCGEPTFRPTAKQLGLESGEIDWERSQIRTFQYAPWNGKRQANDTDRCGIEKGSVFVIKGTAKLISPQCDTVGSYRNEGFGKVIYNPRFLATQEGGNGLASYKLTEEEERESNLKTNGELDTPLINFLKSKAQEEKTTKKIYEEVNKFVRENKGLFGEESFASQWGTIRSLAMSLKTAEELDKKLFTEVKRDSSGKAILDKEGKPIPDAYLTHGVAKEKWEKNRRKRTFEDFFKKLAQEYDDYHVRQALINLAAQMAKIYRKDKQHG